MKGIKLDKNQVLAGYDIVSELYPFTPSLSLWRAWEYAAYRRYELFEPVLDLGCGDGCFFKITWPQSRQVIGLDIQPDLAEAARRLGPYREVHVAEAAHLPFPSECFGSVFANCSLEHMEPISDVLKEVARCLQPRGEFLMSVVTDELLKWSPIDSFLEASAGKEMAEKNRREYISYQHLVALPLQTWAAQLKGAGFQVMEYTPILPEMTSRLFLLLDQLWHLRISGRLEEVGDFLYAYFRGIPDFPKAFRQIVAGFLSMERNWEETGGVVIWCRKRT